jgi:ABC-type spermidine/putrescine transport system permease subunit I
VLLGHSLIDHLPDRKIVFTLAHYKHILQPFLLKILGNSFLLALQTSLICLAIAYPLAYFLTFKINRFRTFFLLLVILPSWTSWIVQIYAWFFLLKKDGIFSQSLYNLGFLANPVHMLNNYFSIMLGMVYCYMPFMVLPIYAVLEKIDRRLIEASSDLGASQWETIKKVVFPLSMTGVIAGLFLVFIPAFGEFAIPEFLGGSKQLFWGNVIVSKFLDYRDWQTGAAATYSGLLFPMLVMLFLFIFIRVMRRLIKTPFVPRIGKRGRS